MVFLNIFIYGEILLMSDEMYIGQNEVEKLFRYYELEFTYDGVEYLLVLDEDADDGYQYDGKYHWIYPEFVCELTQTRWFCSMIGKGMSGDIDWASIDGMLERA